MIASEMPKGLTEWFLCRKKMVILPSLPPPDPLPLPLPTPTPPSHPCTLGWGMNLDLLCQMVKNFIPEVLKILSPSRCYLECSPSFFETNCFDYKALFYSCCWWELTPVKCRIGVEAGSGVGLIGPHTGEHFNRISFISNISIFSCSAPVH